MTSTANNAWPSPWGKKISTTWMFGGESGLLLENSGFEHTHMESKMMGPAE